MYVNYDTKPGFEYLKDVLQQLFPEESSKKWENGSISARSETSTGQSFTTSYPNESSPTHPTPNNGHEFQIPSNEEFKNKICPYPGCKQLLDKATLTSKDPLIHLSQHFK